MHDDNARRVEGFRKDAFAEKYLNEANMALGAVENSILEEMEVTGSSQPLIFVVGVQRSGTTLLNQMIINHFDVAYPNNFVARYWKSPIVGSILFQNLGLKEDSLSYRSDMGYTAGLTGPHEFGYFWRHWFPDDPYHAAFTGDSIDNKLFKKQMNTWLAYQQKPLIFKNLHKVSFRIAKLAKLFPKSIFIHIQRDPFFVAQSTYESRLKLFGSEEEWFGVQPPEFPELSKQSVAEQIAGQIYYTNKFIENEMLELSEDRKLDLSYEELIGDIAQTAGRLIRFLHEQHGVGLSQGFDNVDFKSTNRTRLPKEKEELLSSAIQKYYDSGR
ncbi:MAG: hypothetical protein Roseis2KO_02030 [Roseivirga sp.]